MDEGEAVALLAGDLLPLGGLDRGEEDRPVGLGIHLPMEQEINDFCDVAIDFDYFFCDFPNDKRNLMFSEEYIRALFQEFRKAWDQGTFACITICLSPDEGYSGSWDNAERILEIFNEVFGVPLDIS